MYISISNYGERYLTHDDFLHLCSDLEIKILNSKIDIEWLEFFEGKKILFPQFKLVKPTWYLNYFFKYNNEQLERIKSKRWRKANSFFKK